MRHFSLNHLLLRLISKQTNAKADDSNFYFFKLGVWGIENPIVAIIAENNWPKMTSIKTYLFIFSFDSMSKYWLVVSLRPCLKYWVYGENSTKHGWLFSTQCITISRCRPTIRGSTWFFHILTNHKTVLKKTKSGCPVICWKMTNLEDPWIGGSHLMTLIIYLY